MPDSWSIWVVLAALTDRESAVSGERAARERAARGPFDLLFADSGFRGTDGDLSALLDLVRPRGRIVMDDVTPLLAVPADPDASDVKRGFFFGNPALVSTEVVLPDLKNSLLVGTKRAG